MFRWKRLPWSFAGGPLAKGATSFIFSEVLADTKVHHAGFLPSERDETNDKQKDQSEVKERCRFVLENWKSFSTPGIQGDFFYIVNLFCVVKRRESFPVLLRLPVPAAASAAPLFRCRTRPTQARSSPRPLAWAPLSSGYCTAAGGGRQNTSVTAIVPLSPSESYCHSQHSLWQPFKPNLISNCVKRTLDHVLCLDYQMVSNTTMRQRLFFQSTEAHSLIL